ncbi:hypothetical protein SAMN05421856_101450 [Chryseobacterium taichungense]|uniref:Uncharacterized protein n=1 Tax=Chryseobacterium taichungense TaxID=295069 RepID=A0A1H7W3V7_9FLAO|nr:hypothetical protein SAMN05421856_101450 [Chryseobacterium taichungense]
MLYVLYNLNFSSKCVYLNLKLMRKFYEIINDLLNKIINLHPEN